MESSFSSAASLAARSVHVLIQPVARTLPERREVLRMLERHGEVVMFRSLKYHPINPHPETFLAIYHEAASARALLQQSPIQYQLYPASAISRTAETSRVEQHETDDTPPAHQSRAAPIPRTYTMRCNGSSFNHERYIRDPKTNPLHGPYHPELRSAFSAQLQRDLPATLAAPGLSDWETDSIRRRKWVETDDEYVDAPNHETGAAGLLHRIVGTTGDAAWRIHRAVATGRESEDRPAGPTTTPTIHPLPFRLQQKAMRNRAQEQLDTQPEVMKGLWKLWEERAERNKR